MNDSPGAGRADGGPPPAGRSAHEAANQNGLARLAANDLQGALQHFTRAIELAPTWAEPHKNIGNCHFRAQDLPQARHWYRQALAIDPAHLASWNNLGNVERYLGDLAAAEQALRRAAELAPQDAEVHANLGAVLLQSGQPAQARQSFLQALASNPDDLVALNGLGNLAASGGQPAQAVHHYRRALALDPRSDEVRLALAHQLQWLREWREITRLLRGMAGRDAGAAILCGNASLELGELDAATHWARAALALRPSHLEAMYLLGAIPYTRGNWKAAERAWEELLAKHPDCAEAVSSLLHVKLEACDWQGLDHWRFELARLAAQGAAVHPFDALFADLDAGLRLRSVEQTVAAKFAHLPPLPPPPTWTHARIRLGYFSGDFRKHALPALVRDLIIGHDRSRFEVIAYSTGPDDGSEERRSMVAAFDAFHDVGGQSDLAIAQRIRDDEVDFLIDLSGFTEFGRPGVLWLRPAAVHVNWLGFIGSMGRLADVILADAQTVPSGEEKDYGEHVQRLAFYQPNDAQRFAGLPPTPTRADAGLPGEGFVFCSFSTAIKLAPTVFDAWAAMLRRVPGSVLWLLAYAPAVRENLLIEWQRRGMDAARLVFASRVDLKSHLARLPLADLYLDTLPYSNGTTAADSLFMGVPLLTCRGTGYCGKMGASIAHAAGIPELVVDSLDEYVGLGIALATDRPRLQRLRQRLRDHRTHKRGPLFNPAEVVADLEAAYAELLRDRARWQRPRG